MGPGRFEGTAKSLAGSALRSAIAALQNRILPANSKFRGFPALVIVPKAALPNDPFGSFRGGVLLTLKTSARNSRLSRSDKRNILLIIKSASWSLGPAAKRSVRIVQGR